MKKPIQIISALMSVLCLLLTISAIVTISASKYPVNKFITSDFVDSANCDLSIKITVFTNSAMKNVNNPKEYNRYLDSAVKYISIYRYINKP